ncbi:L-rhamnono-gamma-lactonase [Diaporthe australafricana]|uniref:L-rhamnono-gamma-lactonase n=1 Tax=Diaporthe australafricana TaxID=127596 RepID=A0ABR3XHE9_9PEZI
MTTPVPIIDSHIHLFPSSELETLSWAKPEGPLYKRHSISEYREATAPQHDLLSGFVFLETDRKNDEADPTPDGGWKYPLAEVSWLARIAGGRPRPGEGHEEKDSSLCMGIVPWAPVPAGAEVLERYIDAVRETCVRDGGEGVWEKVKGFRYLLQDKPAKTMLDPKFIDGLKLLGRKGLVFDVGVDQHRRGRAQLEEAVEMVDRAHDGVPDGEKVTFILNHLCKPDLTTLHPADPSFISWRTAIYTLSKADNVYMKLSGAFSEMSDALRRQPANDIFESVMPWLAVVVAAFGPGRIMFGSDWPVSTIGVGDSGEGDDEGAWEKWRKVVDRLCYMSSFTDEEKELVFARTARRAYKLG